MKRLILGGVKSGKSRYAEAQASALSEQVTVIVTAQALDDEMTTRIKRHQADRPKAWQTIEAPIRLGHAVRSVSAGKVVIVDCLTLWLTNLLMLTDNSRLEQELADYEQAVKDCDLHLIMVSNETSMGVIPLGELSRQFADMAGMLHQRLAKSCDRVELMIAGLPLLLK